MNNKLREVVNSISNHKIEFKTFFENEYPILRSHISIINDCIKFSVNKSDATINLVKSFAGFSEYKGWLDENDKIDKTKFIEITESFIDGSSIIDSWETYFLKKMKSIISYSKGRKKFLSGYNDDFISYFKNELNDIFIRVQKITDTILCLGLQKQLLYGNEIGPQPFNMIYSIGEGYLGNEVNDKHRILCSGELETRLFKLLTKLVDDLI